MPGILIHKSYCQFYSFVIADDVIYEETRKEFKARSKDESSDFKLYFDKGNLTLQQIEDAREKTAEIVKRLNQGENVKVKKEISSYFD